MPRIGLLLALLLLSGGCALGPDYQRPELDTPEDYRHAPPVTENGELISLQAVPPADDLPKGEWWQLYHDPLLNDLQQRAAAGNRELRVALARLDQARAAARISDADRLPRLDLQPSAQRSRTPEDLSPMGTAITTTTITLPLNLGYEIDLWGRLRRQSEAAGADFAASTAEVENFRLLLHGEVARAYFSLWTLDQELELLTKTLELRRENLRLVTSRFSSGLAGRLDVSRAESEAAVTEAEVVMLRQRRAELEHALALLLGETTSRFTLPPIAESGPDVPPVAPGLPSALLQRRPDVAAAERRLMAASARIGMAKAAFFPSIRLTGAAGYGSNELDRLLNSGNRLWSLGPQISLPIFDGGRNRARLEQARAAYQENLAAYQQTILQAFKEVDDALVALDLLTEQQQAQQRALAATRQSVELSHHRYRAGLVSYLEVIESERTALTLERAALLTTGQQLQANLALIKALGGGWQDDDLLAALPPNPPPGAEAARAEPGSPAIR
ncbi:efflux transporter outer membrane subunit [Desulfurivibrio sp. D14AmB]|uniref:efflux transporter outer membrane subunit n=1 Tax=Desulfurivibrio sp. D14AmB TaxID=3374370 RepID=UPI00376EEED4